MTMRKRSRVASRTSSSSRSRSRAASWRSSKSTTDSRRFAAAYSDAEALEKLLQEIAIVRRELLERRALGGLARPLERRRARALARERREIDEPLGRRSVRGDAKDLARVPALRRRSPTRRPRAPRPRRASASTASSRLGRSPSSSTSSRPGRAERLVDAREHAPQPVGAVRREQPQALGLSGRAELLQRPLECLAAEHGRARVLDLAEARIEPGGERDARAAAGCRSRGSSRSTRRRARGRDRGGRAREAPRGCGCAAHPPPCACT